MQWTDLKNEFDLYSEDVINYLNDEYSKVRSGRISPNIFDGIRVQAYGDWMPLNQISNVQIVDARTALIKPFDKTILKDISAALNVANLGVSPMLDAEFVKLSFPPITEENRMKNVKKCKEILEQAKVRIRKVREDVKNQYKNAEGVSEDIIFHFNEELDKITKLYNTKLEEIYASKEGELLKI